MIVTCGMAYLSGVGWAIAAGVLITFYYLGQILNNQPSSDKNSTKPDSNQRYNTQSKPRTRSKVIDEIQFSYRPAHGEEGVYTVKLTKGLRGNMEGYCDERDDIRTFRIDRIVNSEITRTATGEVMTVKEWRAMFRKGN